MIKCWDCGHVFEDEDKITVPNYVPYGEGYVAENWDGCPHCHSTDIEEYKEEGEDDDEHDDEYET